MGKKNKDVQAAADQARNEAAAIPQAAATAFSEVVDSLKAKEALAGATEAAGEVSLVPAPTPAPTSENATSEAVKPNNQVAETVATTQQSNEGLSDDTRTPQAVVAPASDTALELPKIVKEKKPPFDWNAKVFKPLKDGFDKVSDVAALVWKTCADYLFMFIMIVGYLILNAPFGFLYASGWLFRSVVNAFMHGYRKDPLIMADAGDLIKNFDKKTEVPPPVLKAVA